MKDVKKKILLRREKINEGLKHASLEMETSTHFPILVKVVQMTDGPILEMGSGLFSTPLLHWLCFDKKRKLITCEAYQHYLEFANRFKTEWHEVTYVKPQKQAFFNDKFSVVFIDHSPKKPLTRGGDALQFNDTAEYIVLHDAGVDAHDKYGYKEIYNQFKYVYHYDKVYPHTTVLSNFHDVTSWN